MLGRPDLAWHGTRVAVFVDGRFCQGCPERHALDWDLPESEQPAVQAEMRRQRLLPGACLPGCLLVLDVRD